MDENPLNSSFDDPQNEQNQQNEDQPSPPSRLDRLMGAKDRAEKEAERWNQIEQQGSPLPSADQDYGMTQPIQEPPRKEGDTPTGHNTPPEGTPRPDFTNVGDTPSAQNTPPGQPKIRKGAGTSFPHPTDLPEQFTEPPMPNNLDQGPGGVSQGGGQPHKKYQPPKPPADVRLDASGMPLPPKRVPRDDQDATIASPSSYQDELYERPEPTLPHGYERPDFGAGAEVTQQSPRSQPTEPHYVPPQSVQSQGRVRLPQPGQEPIPPQPIAPQYVPPVQQDYYYQEPEQPRRRRRRGAGFFGGGRLTWGCLARTMLLSLIGGLVAIMLSGGAGAIYYARVTAPSFRGIQTIADLQGRSLQFETSRIRDREGHVLYEINDPQGGFRDYVKLEEISDWLIFATVATEEREYFTNPGFSVPAILRAVYQNYREGEVVSGASTITQQLTRTLLLPAEQRYERSYERKIKEIFLSAELGRRFSKRDILELYLNQAFYGNFAYGIEAASQTYFHKSAKDLTLAEASFLAGIPQAPAVWDPVTNKEGVLGRQRDVISLMIEAGCLDVGNSGLELDCVTTADLEAARPELETIARTDFLAPTFEARYPHWVVYIQQLLESDPRIGPGMLYTSGLDVYTTLDPRLQDLAQQQVDAVLSGLTDRNVHNASVVVIDPHTGALLAMVGSRDFNDESIDGQVNIALTPQQPGSSIKPFTYLTAFRSSGWTPSTVIWDVPIAYEFAGTEPYEPVNYSGKFWGPVTVRTALSNSLNIPAVLTLDHVGVPALLKTLNDVGVTSLGGPENPYNYSLALTLGAGEIYLIEWTNAFAVIQRGGGYMPLYAIERIERNGQLLEGYPYVPPAPSPVIEPQYAYLIRDIMMDKEARVPSFGRETPLSPPYPAGAKTGTTNDFRDNWTMGFTSELVVGVWVGNTDNSPMINVSGVTGAGPIWRGILDGAQQWYPPQAIPAPGPDLIFQQTVCNDDGAIPSQYCLEHSGTHTDVFAQTAKPPQEGASIYQQLVINEFNGLLANDFCPTPVKQELFLVLPNPSQYIDAAAFARNWLLTSNEGQAWAAQRGISPEQIQKLPPTAFCDATTVLPTIEITNPVQGGVYNGEVQIIGTVSAPNFDHYYVDFGLSEDPIGWGSLLPATNQQIQNGVLATINLQPFQNGPMTIRVVVVDTAGHSAEKRVTFIVEQPTPTPTPTEAPTSTAAPTNTPAATSPPPTP